MTAATPSTVLESLNLGLKQAFEDDPRVILLGEDVLDPYGGAFKVTQGLSSQFPNRVLTTPISEAGITGIAGGMALRGMHPVVEIMFGDFTTLIADQVINHIVKFPKIYSSKVPLTIRTPMGGRRGYGPSHSQTLEKHFLGVPGLTVVAPFNLMGGSPLGSPGQLLYDVVTGYEDPVLFIENKRQYLLKLLTQDQLLEYQIEILTPTSDGFMPFYQFAIKSAPKPILTLAAYGDMASFALKALYQLAYDDEIFCELLIPTQLAPFKLEPLFESVSRTTRLLTVEEGTRSMGWGSEVLARTSESVRSGLRAAARLAATESVIPAATELEAQCLPNAQDIINRVREMV